MIEKLGELAEPLAMIGLFTLALVIFVVIANIYVETKKRIELSIKKYRDRHKYEKPPTAKCYCIACGLWYADSEERLSGRCRSWDGYHTSPDEFCARGYLRSDNEYKDEEWRLKDRS